MKIAYQGVPGSFSHSAARTAFAGSPELVGTKEFREIFEQVSKGEVDAGVVPLENSIAGSVYENYDLLARFDLGIARELYLRIEHCLLMAEPGPHDLSKLAQVFSHAKALEQCSRFLEKFPNLEKIAINDTGTAAKRVAALKARDCAAIGSVESAALYGLKVVQANIENAPNNFTRFVVLSRSRNAPTGRRKCSVIFSLPHKAGSLLALLTLVTGAKANLTKIESRPIAAKPFEYLFYLDFEVHSDPGLLLEELKEQTTFFKLLGEYESVNRDLV